VFSLKQADQAFCYLVFRVLGKQMSQQSIQPLGLADASFNRAFKQLLRGQLSSSPLQFPVDNIKALRTFLKISVKHSLIPSLLHVYLDGPPPSSRQAHRQQGKTPSTQHPPAPNKTKPSLVIKD